MNISSVSSTVSSAPSWSKHCMRLRTHKHDFLTAYVSDLKNVVDMDTVRDAKLRLGVDPLGGAGIDYWPRIAGRQYGLDPH